LFQDEMMPGNRIRYETVRLVLGHDRHPKPRPAGG